MKRYLTILLFLTTTFLWGQSPLCSSYPTNFCCEYVSSITINGQTYAGSTGYSASSGGTGPNGYYDYTDSTPIPTINAGDSISITYTAQTNGNYMEYFKLWVDFNGNGVLSDSGEQVYAYNVSWLGTKTVTSYFIVPTTVYNGAVYMRFMMVYANVPALCGSYAYGNTFDFKTSIKGAQPNPNAPTPTETISGNVNIPTGATNRPMMKLFEVSGSTLTLVDSSMVDSSGGYSLQPTSYNTTYKVIPYFTGSVDTNDFNLILLESLNENTPDNQVFGQYLDTAYKLKAADINKDGKLNVGDAYMVGAKVTGLLQYDEVYWFTETDYNSITNSNYNSINSSSEFTVSFGTSDVTLNLRYIVKGDANLSGQ